MNLCDQLNLLRLMESCEEYSIFIENLEVIQEAFDTDRMYFAESKEDKDASIKAAEKYIKDTTKFIKEKTDKADKYRRLSKALDWLSMGCFIIGPLIGGGLAVGKTVSAANSLSKGFLKASTAASLGKAISVTSIISIMSALVGNISLLAGAVLRDKSVKEILKLKAIRRRLEVYKNKADGKVKEDIEELICKIDDITDKVMDDAANERTVNHNI